LACCGALWCVIWCRHNRVTCMVVVEYTHDAGPQKFAFWAYRIATRRRIYLRRYTWQQRRNKDQEKIVSKYLSTSGNLNDVLYLLANLNLCKLFSSVSHSNNKFIHLVSK
jgi:hypothetical protein